MKCELCKIVQKIHISLKQKYILFVDVKHLSIASASEIHPTIVQSVCLSNSRVFGANLSTPSIPPLGTKLDQICQ